MADVIPSDDDLLAARGIGPTYTPPSAATALSDDDLLKARGITGPPPPDSAPPTQGQAIAGMGKDLYAGFVQGMADSPQAQDIKNSPLLQMAPKIKGLEGLPLPLEEPDFQKQYGGSTTASVGRFMGHLFTSLPLMAATGGGINPLTAPSLSQIPGQMITQAPALLGPLAATTVRNALQATEFSGQSGNTPGQNMASAALGAATGPIGTFGKYLANNGLVDAFLKHPVTQAVASLGGGLFGWQHGGILPALEYLAGGFGASHMIAKAAPVANMLLRVGGSTLTSPAGAVTAGAAGPVVGPLGSDIANDLIPGM